MINTILIVFFIIMFVVIISGKNRNQNRQLELPDPIIGHGDYDLSIQSIKSDRQIEALKEIRAITGYGLREAKDIMDNVPFKLIRNVEKEYAENIKLQLEKCGVIVDITEAEKE